MHLRKQEIIQIFLQVLIDAKISTMPASPKHLKDLYELFSSIDNTKEAEQLLEDILTPQELESLAERWQEIQLLAAGHTQRDVAKKLDISISKVTRGSRMLQYGSGGFMHFLEKLGKIIK
jgi:TrpR family trp operon transcriptional repressor